MAAEQQVSIFFGPFVSFSDFRLPWSWDFFALFRHYYFIIIFFYFSLVIVVCLFVSLSLFSLSLSPFWRGSLGVLFGIIASISWAWRYQPLNIVDCTGHVTNGTGNPAEQAEQVKLTNRLWLVRLLLIIIVDFQVPSRMISHLVIIQLDEYCNSSLNLFKIWIFRTRLN